MDGNGGDFQPFKTWVVVTQIHFFIFTPKLGEDSHFDSYFLDGLKPPTSFLLNDLESANKNWLFGVPGTYFLVSGFIFFTKNSPRNLGEDGSNLTCAYFLGWVGSTTNSFCLIFPCNTAWRTLENGKTGSPASPIQLPPAARSIMQPPGFDRMESGESQQSSNTDKRAGSWFQKISVP